MLAPALRPRVPASSLLVALVLACSGGPESTATADATSDAATSTSTASASAGATSATTSGATTSTSTSTGDTSASSVGSTSASSEPTTSGDPATSSTSESSTSADTSTGTTSTGTSTGTADGTSTGTTGGDEGLGVISGECGLIDAMELSSPDPFVFTSAIDFGVLGYDYDLLTPGGQQIYDEGNLNSGSLHSEVIAYEVLARCDMAALLKTETAIVYNDPMGKKTDFLADIDGLKVGVSVVRAVGFPKDAPYTVAQAETILNSKLGDILISSANVAPEDAWVKQILSVVAYGPMHVESLLTAYDGLDPAIKADTVLVITLTDGDDAFIY